MMELLTVKLAGRWLRLEILRTGEKHHRGSLSGSLGICKTRQVYAAATVFTHCNRGDQEFDRSHAFLLSAARASSSLNGWHGLSYYTTHTTRTPPPLKHPHHTN